jgi:acyl-CoA reductase-like NAD-dependent aldehyde dehydrogenase
MSAIAESCGMLVGGEWIEAADGAAIETRNPATQAVLARIPDASSSGCSI